MKQIALKNLLITGLLVALSGCSYGSKVLNPFYEEPPPEALLGEKNDHALSEQGEKVDSARSALQAMTTYKRAQEPQPVNPVMQPAVVRLMWIPDHLNKNGDLVPQHYYYLKVLNDRWAVQDAFELEQQLGGKGGGASSIPFTKGN
jgi:hypothetical protein